MIKNILRTSSLFSEKYNNLVSNYLNKINLEDIKHNLIIRNDKRKIDLLVSFYVVI